MLNLVDDAWLPIVRQSGKSEIVDVAKLTSDFQDDPIVSLDFQRPDWNSAVTEWLIGIYAVADPIADVYQWFDRWESPLTTGAARDALAPFSNAFNLLGDGARCFQDADPLEEASVNAVDQLLIHAPGANTAKLNLDFFIKRRSEDHILSFADAAAALITLQTYAPSGGAGHRTSMRGGGPLTTMVRPLRRPDLTTLYDIVLANQPRGLAQPIMDAKVFPWLAETQTSRNGEVIIPEMCDMRQAFFGMPRRIRLIGGEAAVTGFRTIPYGVNYAAWRHPLSPYYKNKAEWLPRHPRQGDTTFRDWPTIWGVGEDSEVASCVGAFEDILKAEPVDFDVLALGYDMDNAKARAWQQSSVPYFIHLSTRDYAGQMIAAAGEASSALRFAIKRVMFGQAREKDGKIDIYLSDAIPRTAGVEYGVELERSLEKILTELLRRMDSDAQQARQTEMIIWHTELNRAALRIFDRLAIIQQAAVDDLPLIVRARGGLRATFGAKGKVTQALKLVDYIKAQKANQKEGVMS